MTDKSLKRSFDEWKMGECEFHCSICDNRFSHSPGFYGHLRDVHRVDPREFVDGVKRNRAQYCVKEVFTHCRISGKKIRYDLGKLRSHVNKEHENLSLFDYYRAYIHRRRGGGQKGQMTQVEE